MVDSLAVQMQKVLEQYSEEVQTVTNSAIDKTARESVSKLKSESPRKHGDYSGGWRSKSDGAKNGINSRIVYNSKAPGLTHLLEFGHVTRNAKGTYGRTPAHPHIKRVEEWANDALVEAIERGLT